MKRQKRYDFTVFIARMQPYHSGHEHIIKTALERSETLIIGIGSANSSIRPMNPWDYEQRKEMIVASLTPKERAHVSIISLNDHTYNNDGWITEARKKIEIIIGWKIGNTGNIDDSSVALIGHDKDHTSFYLKLFPMWDNIPVDAIHHEGRIIHASDIREYMFGADIRTIHSKLIPEGAYQWLRDYTSTPEFDYMMGEYEYIRHNKAKWTTAPYDVNHMTADAVVTQSAHVLLVKRRSRPGKGLYSLPGGFVNNNEMVVDAALRELREETRLKVSPNVLRKSIINVKQYDNPRRSERGRIVTSAYHIALEDQGQGLPKVRGSEETEKAFWQPLCRLDATQLFEDHYHIIRDLTGTA